MIKKRVKEKVEKLISTFVYSYYNKIRNPATFMFVGLVVFIEITYNNILLFMIAVEVTDLLCYENENYFSNISCSRSSIV